MTQFAETTEKAIAGLLALRDGARGRRRRQFRRARRTRATKEQRRDRRRHATFAARLEGVFGPLTPTETWRGPAYRASAPNGAYVMVRILKYAGHDKAPFADVAFDDEGPQCFVDYGEDLEELRELWAEARGEGT